MPANSSLVYLLKTGEIDILANIDFCILDLAVVTNEDCRALFIYLGAMELLVSVV